MPGECGRRADSARFFCFGQRKKKQARAEPTAAARAGPAAVRPAAAARRRGKRGGQDAATREDPAVAVASRVGRAGCGGAPRAGRVGGE